MYRREHTILGSILAVLLVLWLLSLAAHASPNLGPCTNGNMVTTDGGSPSCGGVPILAQHDRVSTDNTGLYVWTYPTAYAGGVVPHCYTVAEGANPQNSVNVNAQLEGSPSNTVARFRVVKTTASSNGLLGLVIGVIATGTGVGVTTIDIFCVSP